MTLFRKTILILIVALWPVLAAAQANIWFKQKEIDAGAFNEDLGPREFTFTYFNQGDEPLVITGVRTSCGCTVADYDREAVFPGDSAVIRATYDPAGRLGRFEKSIYVSSNGDIKKTELRIRGVVVGGEASVKNLYPEIHGPIALQKGTVLVGNVARPKVRTEFINAYNHSTDTIVPRIADVPAHLRVVVEPKSIPPGEQASFIIYFMSANSPEWGRIETPVTIFPDENAEPFELPVVATVVEDFTKLSDKDRANAPVAAISPERLIIEGLERDGESRQAILSVKNIGHSDLDIRRVYSDDPGISIALPKKLRVKKGKHIEIPLTITPSELPGELLDARVTVITNDPAHPTQTVRIVGELK